MATHARAGRAKTPGMRRVIVVTLLGLGIVAVPARAAETNVTVANNAFTPAQVTITQGDVVNWDWTGPDGNHSTTTGTDQSETWDSDPNNPSPNHAAGFRFSWVFQKVGEFNYFCKVHSNMTGKVIVVPRGQPQPLPGDVAAPIVGTLRVSVARRRATFKLNESAEVVARLRGRTRRTIEMTGDPGTNVIKLPRMRPGRYALTLRATDGAGNKSTPVQRKFRVRRR